MGERMSSLDLLQLDLTDECPLFCSHCSNSSCRVNLRSQLPGREGLCDSGF